MNYQQKILEAIDETGEVGFLDLAEKIPDVDENLLAVRLGNGELIFVETKQLKQIADDKFRFAGKFQNIDRRFSHDAGSGNQTSANLSNENDLDMAAASRTNEAGEIVVPLIAEEISISKKTVETGGVRVHKIVREDVQTIDEPIIREHLDVERVEVNQFVETAPVIRYEGEVMIVPVLEEVVVTQKRLLLREEIRLTKRREEISNPQQVTLRREEIKLEKIEFDDQGTVESGSPEK